MGRIEVDESRVQDFMKKNPPWFMFDFHPMRCAKKLSKEEKKIEKEITEVIGEEREV